MQVFLDNFTDSADTLLSDHTADSGHVWVTQSPWLISSNGVYRDNGGDSISQPGGEVDALIDPLIPTAWAANEITAKTRCDITGRYLYVFNGSGVLLNESGVLL